MSSLLSSSAATRRSLEGAVADVRSCSSLASATSQIQAVASQRNAEYRRARALSMGGLANGTTVKSDLLAALRASLDADRDYLTWARRQLIPVQACLPVARLQLRGQRGLAGRRGQGDVRPGLEPGCGQVRRPAESAGDI